MHRDAWRCCRAPRPRPHVRDSNHAVGIGDYLATKGIKKAAVQRALDNLAAAGKLVAKVRPCAQAQHPPAPAALCPSPSTHTVGRSKPLVAVPAARARAQEFGKTKIYLPPQDGLAVLSKEVGAAGAAGGIHTSRAAANSAPRPPCCPSPGHRHT